MKILIVDDNQPVLELVVEILKRTNQTVLPCNKSIVAAGLEPTDFDILITDVTMPQLSGIDLAGIFKLGNPNIIIILMSGNMPEIKPEDDHLLINDFLTKPFTSKELLDIVRKYC